MPPPVPPFKAILEMVLWNGLQSCHHITPDVISVINFIHLREQKKVTGG
jgi:light-regulated signal transduction histidine kinase (bacteriophytochrome)